MRDYFLSGRFIDDINMTSRDGSHGEVVTRFAELLDKVWNGIESQLQPSKLWVAIGRKNDMFKDPI
jgi:hypothetical protein